MVVSRESYGVMYEEGDDLRCECGRAVVQDYLTTYPSQEEVRS